MSRRHSHPEIRTYAQADAYLGHKDRRPLPGRATEIRRYYDDGRAAEISIRYHSTDVVTYYPQINRIEECDPASRGIMAAFESARIARRARLIALIDQRFNLERERLARQLRDAHRHTHTNTDEGS